MSVKNIQKVFRQVDAIDLREGLVAYERYHETLRKVSIYYRVGFVQTVAAFAALSPNNDYVGNLRSLVSVIQGAKIHTPPEKIRVYVQGLP